MNLQQLIKQATTEYALSLVDARHLLAHVLAKPTSYLAIHAQEVATPQWVSDYQAKVQRVAQGEPLAYVTNRSDFMGLDFYVDPHVLIPRPETEQLVELITHHLRQHPAQTMLDMCTGSGCILISLLHEHPHLQGTGVDVSPQALAVAKQNALTNQVASRAHWLRSDLFEQLPPQTFDLIVSNPPYIPSHEMMTLDAGIMDHEPHVALHGGDSGLIFYETISQKAKAYLNPGGRLFFEIGYNQAQAVQAILASNGYTHIHHHPDYAGHDRMIHATYL